VDFHEIKHQCAGIVVKFFQFCRANAIAAVLLLVTAQIADPAAAS
jgi:hypothetical protein